MPYRRRYKRRYGKKRYNRYNRYRFRTYKGSFGKSVYQGTSKAIVPHNVAIARTKRRGSKGWGGYGKKIYNWAKKAYLQYGRTAHRAAGIAYGAYRNRRRLPYNNFNARRIGWVA